MYRFILFFTLLLSGIAKADVLPPPFLPQVPAQSGNDFSCTYTVVGSASVFSVQTEKGVYILPSYPSEYPVVSFRLPFITLKYNARPFLTPEFLMKFLYLLKFINFRPMVSDAMRTDEEQQKYLKRRWSDRDVSPHMLATACDLVYYNAEEREKMKSEGAKIGVRVIEHGRRANRHMHSEDLITWMMTNHDSIRQICNNICNGIADDTSTVRDGFSQFNTMPSFLESYSTSFYVGSPSIVKLEIKDLMDKKCAEVTSGVYKQGNSYLRLAKGLLQKGIYKITLYLNSQRVKEEVVYLG